MKKQSLPQVEESPEKFVKKKISFPPEIYRYVQFRASAAAKLTGIEPNISGAVATIIAERKQQGTATEKTNGHK